MNREEQNRVLGAVISLTYSLYPIEMTEERNALVLGVVAALMLLEPHLSGTLLILGIGAVLMFVGGTGLRWWPLRAACRPSRPFPPILWTPPAPATASGAASCTVC